MDTVSQIFSVSVSTFHRVEATKFCFLFTAGRIVTATEENPSKKMKRDKNIINVKVQSAGLKKPIVIETDKTKSFYAVLFKCAEAMKLSTDQLRLEFDGEPLELDSTPMDLDFDGGEVLDCHVST